MSSPTTDDRRTSQTLDRGLQVLQVLADAPAGMTLTELSGRLDIHRSIVRRLLLTLAGRRFVVRTVDARYRLGPGLASLTRGIVPDLQAAALPEMSLLAERAAATAVLHVADGQEAVALLSVEPRSADVHLSVRPGRRFPLGISPSGIAILAGRAPTSGERPEVTQARQRGFAHGTGEIAPGFAGVAAPVRIGGTCDASLAVVAPTRQAEPTAELVAQVRSAAQAIAEAASGTVVAGV